MAFMLMPPCAIVAAFHGELNLPYVLGAVLQVLQAAQKTINGWDCKAKVPQVPDYAF
jgi:hypothetical protein